MDKLQVITGTLNQSPGQLEFINPPLTFFPNQQQNLWYNKKPVQSYILAMVGRDATGSSIALGADRYVGFGTRQAFIGDRMLYDAMNLRDGLVAISYTACGAKGHVANCFWNFKVHVEMRFAGAGLNGFNCKVEHYRGGALLRTYNVAKVFTPGGDYVGSFERGINGGGGGFSEDVIDGDYFKCSTGCELSSANQINNLVLQRWEITITPKV